MESGEVNAKRGCGRGAAVVQLTARGMDYQSPRWGVIVDAKVENAQKILSIPAMGAIGRRSRERRNSKVSIPAMGRTQELQLNVNKPNI